MNDDSGTIQSGLVSVRMSAAAKDILDQDPQLSAMPMPRRLDAVVLAWRAASKGKRDVAIERIIELAFPYPQ